MTGARSGLVYIVAGAGLAYLWVTGNLAKVTDYLTRAAGGVPANPAALQAQHPIQLPRFGAAAVSLIPLAHPGNAPVPNPNI